MREATLRFHPLHVRAMRADAADEQNTLKLTASLVDGRAVSRLRFDMAGASIGPTN